MTPTRKQIVILAGIVTAVVVALCLLLFRDGNTGTALDWQPGLRYRYALNYHNTTESSFGDTSLGGAVDINADLVFRCLEKNDDGFLLGVRFGGFEHTRFEVLGERIVDGPVAAEKQLGGSEAVASVNLRGVVESISFATESSPLLRNTLQGLLGDLQMVVEPNASEWNEVEVNQNGTLRAGYVASAGAAGGRRIQKAINGYDALTASAGATKNADIDASGSTEGNLDPQGHWARISGKEQIAVRAWDGKAVYRRETVIRATLLDVGAFKNEPLVSAWNHSGRIDRRGLGELVVSPSAHQRELEQRAAGMTTVQVVSDLKAFANGGRMPWHSRWIWRATGALKLDPAGCKELVDVFFDPVMSRKGKTGVLELLAAVGHEQAQIALGEILSDDGVRADSMYPDLIQRAGLLKNPNRATCDLVAAAVSGQAPQEGLARHSQLAAAHTLGTVTRRLSERGEEQLAREYHGRLVGLLNGSANDEDRIAYLTSLGNAKQEATAPVAEEYLDDENPRVRRAAVGALRGLPSERAAALIGEMVADGDPAVQRTALEASAEGSRTDLGRIEQLVSDGGIHSNNFGAVLRLAAQIKDQQGSVTEQGRALLAALARQDVGPRLRHRLRALLGRAS